MKRSKYNLNIVLSILVELVLLTGCGGSNDTTDSELDSDGRAANIYANGYRLVKFDSTLNFLTSAPVTTTTYEYDFADKEIIRTRISDEEDEPQVSVQLLDDAGRLIGGSYDYSLGTLISGTTDYELRYGPNGNVLSYSESAFDNFSFAYTDERLTRITHFLSSSVYTFDLNYDTNGVRTSTVDAVTSVTTHFTYNDKGQPISAQEIDQFGDELFSYDFDYDVHGNHVSTLSYTPFGVLFSTDIYTYEESLETVFNHGIMRQQIQPFETTNINFVR